MNGLAPKNKRVVVIGAGFGGLTAAAYLAQAGFNVTLLEKNGFLGGRAQVWHHKPYTFDLGPTWYWMPQIFERVFQDFGHQTTDFYRLNRLDPSYRIYFDNEAIDLPANREGMAALFERFEPGAGKKLLAFLDKTEAVYHLAMNHFVQYPYTSAFNIFNPDQILGGLKILRHYNGFRSVEHFLTHNFSHPKLIKILSFPIFFLGESTRNIPSVYNLMNHVDIDQGTWYPGGGFGQVVAAFEKICVENGVELKTNQAVTRFQVSDKKIVSVLTKNQEYPADIVLANADYPFIETTLLPRQFQSYPSSYWEKRRLAPSALLMYLGLNRPLPGLLHHTLFFHHDWNAHNQALFTTPRWPQAPLYYVSAPTKTDSSLAPLGHETLTILIPLASGLSDSQTQRSQLADSVINDLAQKLNLPLSQSIKVKRLYSLTDFKTDYHAYKGNGYGLGQTLFQTAPFRPRFNSQKVKNLFYTGQFTVPGIGVPLVILSGKLVASSIIKSYGRF